ncbi:hypothetical protein LX36DRAFT_459132 [Colletotrichum falcatum]|nr:hypothetical protein LX36DRAFT_459132 [Colletotrichum falcatum]
MRKVRYLAWGYIAPMHEDQPPLVSSVIRRSRNWAGRLSIDWQLKLSPPSLTYAATSYSGPLTRSERLHSSPIRYLHRGLPWLGGFLRQGPQVCIKKLGALALILMLAVFSQIADVQ